MTVPTTFAPAVLASDASSPSGSRGSAVERGRITPTSTARSCRTVSSVRFSSAMGGLAAADSTRSCTICGMARARVKRARSRSPTVPLCRYADPHIEDLRETIPKALDDFDADAIHDARVATRRLRAALDLLEPAAPPKLLSPLNRTLRRLRK